MDCKINIFLDDLRDTPKGFLRTFTVNETIEMLKKHHGNVGILSLDNDLSENQPEGHKVADWIEKEVFTNENFVPPDVIVVHSANPVRESDMKVTIRRIQLTFSSRKK